MNRAFPGHAEGSPTEMIAHYLTTVLFPLTDAVIDIHTGGRSLDFYPCSTMHLVSDREQRRKMIEAALAWTRITLMAWPAESCSSRAMRVRSSAAARRR